MEFKIDNKVYGINVSKVLEIMQYSEVTPMPKSNEYVEGIFKPRNEIMTVIDLANYLGLNKSAPNNKDIFIITKFNQISTAFHVHSVEGIHRISWSDVEKPDPTIYGYEEGVATGIARVNDRLVTIIDFEKILAEINPNGALDLSTSIDFDISLTKDFPIMVAEDSPTLMKAILQYLTALGYTKITRCSNGQEAYDILMEYKSSGGEYKDYISCLITDIEMPKMDGHNLLKKLRDDEFYSEMPIIIFSSLITDEMKIKGESLGATEQITKPEIKKLATLLAKNL